VVAAATPTSESPSGTYSAAVSASSVQAGVATPITVTLTNGVASANDEGSTLYIGSATVTMTVGELAPSAVSATTPGWVATLASGTPAVVTLTPSSTTDPGVAPGASVSVGFILTVPVGSGSHIAITTDATPSSTQSDGDFDDVFTPAMQSFPISVLEPSYTLGFSPAVPAVVQESQAFCGPVSVQLYQAGTRAAVSGIPVEITGAAVSPSAALPDLAGTSTVSTNSEGLAVFGDCSSGTQIDNLGTFALQATSSSPLVVGAVTSEPIMVLQSYTTCTDTCSVTVTSATTGVSATIKATGKGKFNLGASFGEGLTPACASQVNPGPWDPLFVGEASGVSGTVTMTFPKEIVNTQANSGRPHMQVCAHTSTSQEFQAIGGGATADGLVADCVNGTYPYNVQGTNLLGLCVQSRAKGSLGHETVVLQVSNLGDPSFW